MLHKKEDLGKIIESLESKVHNIVYEDREGQFLVDNMGDQIELVFMDGQKITGKLVDIDKNRISIEIGNREYYYYKHSIKGYNRL